MRHRRIASSNRHKKLKAVKRAEDELMDERPANVRNMSQQSIPRKWTQILEMKKQMQSKPKLKKKKNDLIRVTTDSNPIEKGMTRSDKPLPPVIEQGLYESEHHFLNRLSRLSAKARAEATIEDRFDVDFCQRVDTNDDIEDVKSNNKAEDNSKTKSKRSKNLKQKLRRIKNKEKRQMNQKDDSFSHLSDSIVFGERVDGPPLLAHLRPKKLKK